MSAYGSIFFCSDEDNENKYMGTFREALFEQRTGEVKPTHYFNLVMYQIDGWRWGAGQPYR